MKEYDLYFPLHYNDGRPIDTVKLNRFKKLLVDHFGGVTHFPQENEGLWKLGGMTFRDKIVILRVLADDAEKSRAFFAGLKRDMERELHQSEVLIVEREVSPV